MALLYEQTTSAVIGAVFEVHNFLGYGFLEKVYQRAMQVELVQRGHIAETEHPIRVHYRGKNVGDYFADQLVDGKIIVERKVAKECAPQDGAQLLKATGMNVGLLINFGQEKVESNALSIYATDASQSNAA